MLKAGFARLDVTPPLGSYLSGYPNVRLAEFIHDPLYVNTVIFSDGVKTVAAISLDEVGLRIPKSEYYRKLAAERNHLDFDAVMIACTHIHTGPAIEDGSFPDDLEYNETLGKRIADSVTLAIQDMQPAKLRYGKAKAENIAFIRRFRMKDGSAATNPGRHNPYIDHPIGEPDEDVQVIRIERENAKDILMVNFQVHPDVVGIRGFSADWPGVARDTVEAALGDVHCILFNGAEGDTNHVDVNCHEWDSNGGIAQATHMGHKIAGAVLSVCDKCAPTDGEKVDFAKTYIDVELNVPKPEDIPWAERAIKLYNEGRINEISDEPMGGAIAYYSALRMLALKDSAPTMKMCINALRFGDFAITGAPGEPFTDVGTNTKARSPFAMTFYCCLWNGCESYYPNAAAFAEGGYEAKTSRFNAGIAEAITEGNVEVLNKLIKQ